MRIFSELDPGGSLRGLSPHPRDTPVHPNSWSQDVPFIVTDYLFLRRRSVLKHLNDRNEGRKGFFRLKSRVHVTRTGPSLRKFGPGVDGTSNYKSD